MPMRWFVLFAVAVSLPARAQAPGDLVLNEIMYDPPAAQPSGNEWVEVLNVSGRSLDVSGLALGDGSGTSAGVPAGTVLADGAYLVLVDNGATFAAAYPGVAFVELAGFPALNNTGDRPALLLGGAEIDAVPYRPSWGGTDASLERRDPLGASTAASNFGTSTDPDAGTPGEPNTQFAPDTAGPALTGATASADGQTVTVTVDEPLDPASVSPGAFSIPGATVAAAAYLESTLTVTLSLSAPLAPGEATVTARGLRDRRGNTTASSAATVVYAPDRTAPSLVSAQALDAQTVLLTFDEALDPASAQTEAAYQIDGGIGPPAMADLQDDPTQVVLALATLLTGPARYVVTVQNVQDLAGNAGSGSAAFFFGQGAAAKPGDLVLNEFLYDEPSADTPGEFVELYNRSDRTFDLRDFTLNDDTGDDEPIATEPVLIGPGEYVVLVEDGSLFEAVFPGVPFVDQPSWSALNNTGDQIILKYQGTVIDQLAYTAAWGGIDVSLERKDPDGPSVRANFAVTTDPRGGTPGAQNSQFAPDVTGPQLLAATASPDGQTVLVTLDEPVDPATVSPAAFAVSGGPTVTAAVYDPAELAVTLALSAPLAAGASTVSASDLADLQGNVSSTTSVTVSFTPDAVAPSLARATALSATTVRAAFSEPVTVASATAASAYEIPGGPGVASVAVDEASGLGVTAVVLTLAAPLADQTLYTLAATGLVDPAGNSAGRGEVRFFFGTPDTPGAGDVVITEILYDPATGSEGEYLEVLNATTDRLFDLRAITLDDGDAAGEPLAREATVLLPGEYLALVRDADGFRRTFPDAPFLETGSGVSLSNAGEALVLRAGATVLDSVFYDPDWHRVELEDATGLSLERRDPAGSSTDPANWSSSLADLGGSPSAPNTLSISGTPVEREAALRLTSPFAPTRGEAARITYTLSSEAGLVRARIYDGGGRLVRQLEAGRLSPQTGTLVWDGTGDDRRPQRAGIYVVLVEAVDAQGGTSDALRGAIVLARPE